MLHEFVVKTTEKEGIIDITSQVKDVVRNSKVKEGICLVYAKHATAAIIINENADEGFKADIITALDKIIPLHDGWKHDLIDNNAAAHLKSTLLGCEKAIPIKSGSLQLGTWQGIALAEFDGPRERHILVKISEDK